MNAKSSIGRMWKGLVLTIIMVGALPTILAGQEMGMSSVQKDLEQELSGLLKVNDPGSKELSTLLRLSALYLDLGYGIYTDSTKKMVSFQEGARWAKQALELREASARAHFLYAANLGSKAELEGLFASALTLQEIRGHVERALELDQNYAPAHHMLGRMYEELPWILGGDQKAAGEHLRMAVNLDTWYAPARLDLAKWLIRQGQEELARQELTIIIGHPPLEKIWLWLTRYKPEAAALLQEMEGGGKPSP